MNFRSIPVFSVIISFSLAAFAQNEQRDTTTASTNDTAAIFEKLDIEASFPGGNVAWRKFLERNLRADVATENGAPCGEYTVWVQFIVDKQGNITDVKSLTNFGYGMEKEVERIIKVGPPWQPASQNGHPVKAYRKQPVTFLIEDADLEFISKDHYIFYVGVDNPLKIHVKNVEPDQLQVALSEGTIISKGGGEYIVRVTRPGRTVLHLFNKKNREIGTASFEVRKTEKPSVPDLIKG